MELYDIVWLLGFYSALIISAALMLGGIYFARKNKQTGWIIALVLNFIFIGLLLSNGGGSILPLIYLIFFRKKKNNKKAKNEEISHKK